MTHLDVAARALATAGLEDSAGARAAARATPRGRRFTRRRPRS